MTHFQWGFGLIIFTIIFWISHIKKRFGKHEGRTLRIMQGFPLTYPVRKKISKWVKHVVQWHNFFITPQFFWKKNKTKKQLNVCVFIRWIGTFEIFFKVYLSFNFWFYFGFFLIGYFKHLYHFILRWRI